MHIVFLLRLWPVYGGGETVTLRLANEFVKRSIRSTVVYFEDSVAKKLPFVDNRIETFRIPDSHCNQYGYKSGYADYIADKLVQYINDNQVDIVINQWWPVEFVKRIKKETQAKVIKCHHSAVYWLRTPAASLWGRLWQNLIHPFSKWHRKKLLTVIGRYLPYCDKYVFLSPVFQQQYATMRKFEDKHHQLDAVPNPLVYDDFFEEQDLDEKSKEVLYVGRMVASKRVELILKSWKVLQDQGTTSGWILRIVGDGKEKKNCEKIVADNQLKGVCFEGFQLPLEYYKKASLFVMTSANEGFGMTLLEAQQNGVVPVVMDSFISLHDIVQDGYNGRITENGNVDAFAAALAELMTDDARRNRLATQAIRSCRKFSIQAIADRWEALFARLLAK